MFKTALAELASLRNPRTLMLGVVNGYSLTFAFGILTAVAVATNALHWHWALGALIGAKLFTNTLAFIALRTDRFALELGGLNVAMDAVVMTGAIWATGDTASPIVAIYTIEVTVLALLTNLTCTVAIGAFSLLLFIGMGLLTDAGVLPRFPTLAEWSGRSGAYLVTAFVFVGFVIAVPTFYTSQILRRLRDNERRLEGRTRQLVDAGKQRAQFMANMTHELRTPLQGIIGLSDLVGKGIYGTATEKQRVAMTELKASAYGLLGLIDDLLQLAMLDAGRLEVKASEVSLDEMLPRAISTARWLVAGKELKLELEAEPSLPLITTDRGKLTQIVLNLVSNAIKFTPDGGTIVLRARRDGDLIRLEIEDSGIGIPDEELERIFDEFHQVDGSTSREYGGVGLGLGLVRRLLAMIGGSIAVRSTVGKGSTFTVSLPLVLDESKPA